MTYCGIPVPMKKPDLKLLLGMTHCDNGNRKIWSVEICCITSHLHTHA